MRSTLALAALALALAGCIPIPDPNAPMAHAPPRPTGRNPLAGADGFSLNVSNYFTTEETIAYGNDVSSHLGGKHFVIDTSRNGNGTTADKQWCNPDGRAIGPRPTTSTGSPIVDAYLWIKPPGESDGTCNGGPRAGEFWPDQALGLARRAH